MQPLTESERRRAREYTPELTDEELDEYEQLAAQRLERLAMHGGDDPPTDRAALASGGNSTVDQDHRLQDLYAKVFGVR